MLNLVYLALPVVESIEKTSTGLPINHRTPRSPPSGKTNKKKPRYPNIEGVLWFYN